MSTYFEKITTQMQITNAKTIKMLFFKYPLLSVSLCLVLNAPYLHKAGLLNRMP